MAQSMIGSIVVFVIFLLIIAAVFYFVYDYSLKENGKYRMLTKGYMFKCPNTCYCPPKKDEEKEERELDDPTVRTDCEACKDIDKNFCFNCDLIEGGVDAYSLDDCKKQCDITYQCDAILYDPEAEKCRLLYFEPYKLPGNTVKASTSESLFGWKIKPSGKYGGNIQAAPLFSGKSYSEQCMKSEE